jgi:hypothetical protein
MSAIAIGHFATIGVLHILFAVTGDGANRGPDRCEQFCIAVRGSATSEDVMGEAGTKPAGLRLGGNSAAPAATTLPASENQSKTQIVRIWLYGALSQLCHERPLTIEFPRGITVSEMIEILSRHVGSDLIEKIMETPSRKLNVCRIFLDGTLVGLDDRLPDAAGGSAEFEMIMLTAIEGG